MEEISDFISTVGFPILVCLLLIYQQQKLSENYIDIVNSLKELISDNTKIINLVISRAKSLQGVIDENKQETSSIISGNEQGK